MYLTRFRLNTGRPGARRLLASPHQMHGAVNMAFPDPQPRDGQGPRVLWRVDSEHPADTKLYIVSPERPDLTHLKEQAGWPTLEAPGWSTFLYGEFLNDLREGDIWGFRLTANPVHHIRRPEDSADIPTKRTAHRTARHQTGWLMKQRERAGFDIVRRPPERRANEHDDGLELIVRDHQPLRFHRSDERQRGTEVRFTRVTFDGRLRITDLAKFRRTLTHGLGKAKAYGCGLITLAPVERG
ncbi:type I-E CRISPR-associated protein Cas6/Cse3/CasE [Streptomyces sp. 3MP-14]|uniref:Type I-E CRISPR-associated protein Cas6/Cse3/CasE n=1 Tax=Streptomyces mimosae TaxID=2586635 RepID=A0A5N6ANZ4_9ACTN|nr:MULTISPECIES: type I-E CRISPR-associated protein Cas6/Cse3/CasE [Streptomyces]KAB8169842.1 type I-E CRISPR-associated protein Cas6/Cse3/CasE [Streptomyces mimosae]KAB8178590.1 type I-E CRISPR-associated protein Cas6/Cse3/CasE [Streptomyces sp. 3MP-14]